MDLNQLSLLNVASQKMEYLSNRQKVISENVANADTPGYKAKETASFKDFLNASDRTVGTFVTNEKHITKNPTRGLQVENDKNAWGANPNGNTVSLEQQSIKSAGVRGGYDMAANLYKKSFNLYFTAIGKGK
jgi:flagellar basal-body rod protein FlgB